MSATKTKQAQSVAIRKQKKTSAKIIRLNTFKQPHQIQTETLVNALWGVASSAFWFNKAFTEPEITSFKELLGEHFFNGKSSQQNFKELIERICLAKRYVTRKHGRYVAKPQDYLNIYYPLGLTGTSAWLQQVNVIRKNVPDYNKGITLLAKALLAFIEKPNAAVYQRGRKQLIGNNQFDLLQLFNNTIIHLQF